MISLASWFDSSAKAGAAEDTAERIDWLRVLPFIGMHLACLGVIWVGFSWFALAVAIALYAVRMFAITGFYHRYFSHKGTSKNPRSRARSPQQGALLTASG